MNYFKEVKAVTGSVHSGEHWPRHVDIQSELFGFSREMFIRTQSPGRNLKSIKLASDTYTVNQILTFSNVNFRLQLASEVALNYS